uniref:GAIN-B domain-containing protein n=1 Tax=Esox lucius TaxID=8010 RepID=A0A3P8YWW7_ESOLU
MLIRTRKYVLQMEIEDINQCNYDQTEVTLSFTWRTDCKLPQMLNISPSSDCAINIMQPNDENCQIRPLQNCVDKWTFIMNIEGTDNQISTVITKNNITTDPPGPFSFTVHNSEGVEQKNKEKVPISVPEFNRTCTGQAGTNCHFTSIKNILNRFIKEGPQKVKLNNIKGSVTFLQNISRTFRMALPSTNNVMLEEKDDIWLEIPMEALRVFPVDTADQVNLGVFWFEDDTLFPTMENNTRLLNNRVVAIEVGEDISSLSNCIKIIFLFQNASLVNRTLTCVFWDVGNDNVAHWNSSGCVTKTKKNGTLCSCNHLSFYAVLLAPGNVSAVSFPVASLTSFSVWLLTLLSRVGCGISFCFLCLAVLIHLRSNSTNIYHLH